MISLVSPSQLVAVARKDILNLFAQLHRHARLGESFQPPTEPDGLLESGLTWIRQLIF